jgi:hypothetical protein
LYHTEAKRLRDISFDHFDPAGKVNHKHEKGDEPAHDVSNLNITDSLLATTPKHTDTCHHNAGKPKYQR